MANPSFWYFAGGSYTDEVTEIQFGGPLSELSWVPIRDRRSGWTLAGSMRSVVNTGRLRVTISLGPFNDSGSMQYLAHQLESMSAHLERGEPVSFAADRNKAFAAGLSLGVNPGDTSLLHTDNLFEEYGGSIALAANDILCIESPNPEHKREYVRVSDPLPLAANSMTLADAVRYEYTELPVMVRHRDFFPVLYMPEQELGKSIVTWDHRLTFSLDVTLETSPDDLAALGWDPYDLDSSITVGTPPAGLMESGAGKGYSLQESISLGRRESRTSGHSGLRGTSSVGSTSTSAYGSKRKW